MCNSLKIVPDKFRDVVGLNANVETHLTRVSRTRRRAVWSGVSTVLKRGMFAAKSQLKPHFHIATAADVKQYGAINQGGFVTIVGIADKKLTIYAVVDRVRLLKRAGEQKICSIIDETITDGCRVSRIRIIVAEYQFMIWSAWTGFANGILDRAAKMLDLLPDKVTPIWQQNSKKRVTNIC